MRAASCARGLFHLRRATGKARNSAAGMKESVGANLLFVVAYGAILVARRTLSGSCFTVSCSGMLQH